MTARFVIVAGALADGLRRAPSLAPWQRFIDWCAASIHEPGRAPVEADLGLALGAGMACVRADAVEAALMAFATGHDAARSLGSPFWVSQFGLLGARCAVEALDFDAADDAIRLALQAAGAVRGWSVSFARDACRRQTSAVTGDPASARAFRADSLATIAAYWNAVGRIASAAELLEDAIASLGDLQSPTLDVRELRLFHAETLLDLGRINGQGGVDEYLRVERSGASDPRFRRRWSLLEGSARHLEGRLTEAESALREAIEEGPSDDTAIIARWQRTQVLAHLNRLDEAESELRNLESDATGTNFPVSMLRGLVRSRREGINLATWTPPAPREVFAHVDEVDCGAAVPRPVVSRGPIERTSSRVRDDWGRIAASFFAEASEGQFERARETADVLVAWTAECIESELLAARAQFLAGVVDYGEGQFHRAASRAQRSFEAFETLGLLRHAWSSLCLLRWSRLKGGADDSEVGGLTRRLHDLQQRMLGSVAAGDRMVFRLNKWTQAEDELARRCEAAEAIAGSRRSPFRRRKLLVLLRSIDEFRGLADAAMTPEDGSASLRGDDAASLMAWEAHQRSHAPWRRFGVDGVHPGWLPRDEAVLQYIVVPNRVTAFLVDQGGVRLLRLPRCSRVELWHRARAALESLRTMPRWTATETALQSLSAALGIDAVAEALPRRIRRLAIIADDLLVHVPFAALPLNGEPLIRRWVVERLPAFRWDRRTAATTDATAPALLVGVPKSKTEGFAELANAAEEVAAVAGVLDAGIRLVGPDATLDRVMDALGRARIAHFACHGEFDAHEPQRSGILLYDGWLTLDRLSASPLDLDAVVLACCWGGNVRTLPGRETLGLSTVLLRQGVRSVISSLWDLDDAESVEMSRRLWAPRALRDAAARLAEAQRGAIDALRPRTWAALAADSSALSTRFFMRCWLNARAMMNRSAFVKQPGLDRAAGLRGRSGGTRSRGA